LLPEIISEALNTRGASSRNVFLSAASGTLAAMGSECLDGLLVNIRQVSAADLQPSAKVSG
jgi:hypothetical protein